MGQGSCLRAGNGEVARKNGKMENTILVYKLLGTVSIVGQVEARHRTFPPAAQSAFHTGLVDWLTSIPVSFWQLFQGDCCYYAYPWVEFIIALAGLLLWLASSVVLANFDANNSLPKSDWRTTVVILAWVNTLLFIILTTIASTSVSPLA